MAYRDIILADSPTGYWRLGEGSGTNAADETSGLDGTYVGSPTLGATGLISDPDTSVTFNGTTQYVTVGNIGGNAVTVECWFNTAVAIDKNSAGQSLVNCNGTFFALYLGEASVSFANEVISTGDSGGGRSGVLSDTVGFISAGTHYLVAVWSGSQYDFWLDGVAQTTTNAATPVVMPSDNVDIARRGDGTFLYTGTVDEVAIYPTALSTAQIAEHYDIGVNGVPITRKVVRSPRYGITRSASR